MGKRYYRFMESENYMGRREFLKMSGGIGSMIGAGLILGTPALWGQEQTQNVPPPRPKTNLDEVLKIQKTKY